MAKSSTQNRCISNSCLARGFDKLGRHVCVLGTIGAGKTTLARELQKVIIEEEGRCEGLWEPVGENPILPLYYQNPEKYAFIMQVNMLNARLRQQKLAQAMAMCGVSSVQDSSVFGDTCFVEMLRKDGTMAETDVDVYVDLFLNMTESIRYPSLIVYLDCEASVARARIRKRGRECESEIQESYLTRLNAEISTLVAELSKYTHVMRINANRDMEPPEITALAREVYARLRFHRQDPIISRLGL